VKLVGVSVLACPFPREFDQFMRILNPPRLPIPPHWQFLEIAPKSGQNHNDTSKMRKPNIRRVKCKQMQADATSIRGVG